MNTIKVYGLASNKMISEISISKSELNLSLLILLRNHQIPIASSCIGEQICGHCNIKVFEKKILACSITVEHLLTKSKKSKSLPIIFVNYL